MAEILKIDPRSPDPAQIARAAGLVRRGEVIAIPTDTFYGLAANPFDPAAVEKVFSIKGRPKSAPLLLLVESLEMAADLSPNVPPLFYRLARRFWPGPLTIVVEASPKIPPAVTAGTGRIGLRWPEAAIAVALIRAAGCPITATSANRSGEMECSSAEEVAQQFGRIRAVLRPTLRAMSESRMATARERSSVLGQPLALIIDGGPSRAAKPSTVVSLTEDSWEILREGAVSRAEIEKAVTSEE